MAKREQKPGFEAILKELGEIVAQMESGELELERSITLFERGMGLMKQGEKILEEAQQRVELLVKNGTIPFEEA